MEEQTHTQGERTLNSCLRETANRSIEGRENNLILEGYIKETNINNITSDLVQEDSFYQDLTLNMGCEYRYDYLYTKRRASRNDFKAFANYLTNLEGSTDYWGGQAITSFYEAKKEHFKGLQTLYTVYNKQQYPIAYYSKNRNLIISAIPIHKVAIKQEKNLRLRELIRRICEAVKKENLKPTDNSKELLRIKLNVFLRQTKRRYVSLVSEEQELRNSEEEHYDSYLDCKSKREDLTILKEKLKQVLEQKEEGLLKQFNEVRSLAFIKSCEIENGDFIIKFKECYKLFSKTLNKNVDLGEFKAILKPNKISMINKQPVYWCNEWYHSPHIRGDNVCFGQQRDTIHEFLRVGDFKRVALLLHLFLKTYNPEDTFISMDLWAKGKENGGTVPECEEDEEELNEEEDNT